MKNTKKIQALRKVLVKDYYGNNQSRYFYNKDLNKVYDKLTERFYPLSAISMKGLK